MSVVEPVTIAWQRVNVGSSGDPKEIETFDDLEPAIERAKSVLDQANDSNDDDFTAVGSNPEAHLTLHPGEYTYGNSLTSGDLDDIFITLLPGAIATDASSTFPSDATSNVADMNAFASRVFFASSSSEFIFDDPVIFRDGFDFQDDKLVFELQNLVESGIRVESGGTGSELLYNVNDQKWTFDDDVEVLGDFSVGTLSISQSFSVNTTSDIDLTTDGAFTVTSDSLDFNVTNAGTQDFGTSLTTNVGTSYDLNSNSFNISGVDNSRVAVTNGLLELIGNNIEIESTTGNVEIDSASDFSLTATDALLNLSSYTLDATNFVTVNTADWDLEADTATAFVTNEFVIDGTTGAEFIVNIPINFADEFQLTGDVTLNNLTVTGTLEHTGQQVNFDTGDFISLDATNDIDVLAPDIDLSGTVIDVLATDQLSLLSNNTIRIDANNQTGTGASTVELYGDEVIIDPLLTTSAVDVGGELTILSGNNFTAESNADVLGTLTASTFNLNSSSNLQVLYEDSNGNIVGTSGFEFDTGSSTLSAPTGDFDTVNVGTLNFDSVGSASDIPAAVDSNSPSSTSLVSEQALVDFVGTSVSAGVSVSDNGTQVVSESTDVNFNTELDVSDDGDSTVTVDLSSAFIDRVDTLENLLPSAPSLSAFNSTSGSTMNLSFGSSNSISGVTNVPGKDVNDTFTTSGSERGVVGPTSVTVDGRLNPNVSSTDEHGAQIFGDAETGVLLLIVNGTTVNTADLDSTSGSINTVSNGTGFDLSSSSDLTFPDGSGFSGSKQRSGTWQVSQSDMREGYNTIRVRHETDSGSLIGETSEIEYVLDADTDNTTFANETLNSFFGSGQTFLSGVEYYESAGGSYSVDVENIYKNAYDDGNVVTYSVTNSSLSSEQIPNLGGTETDIASLSRQPAVNVDRLIGGSISVSVTVTDSINGQASSNGVTSFDILLDNAPDQDSDLSHEFTTEEYRQPSTADFDTSLPKNNWNSSNSIKDGVVSGYSTALQTVRGQIEYPDEDFSQYTDAPSGNPDYTSGVTGDREYYGAFFGPGSTSSFEMTLNGTGTTLISEDTTFSSTDEIKVSVKNPSGSPSRWYDITQSFDGSSDPPGAFFEANGEASSGDISGGYDIGQNETIGLQVPDPTGPINKLYYRITGIENWSGAVTDIAINWGA